MSLMKILTSAASSSEATSDSTSSSGEVTLTSILDTVVTWLAEHGVKLLIGLVALFIFFQIVNLIAKSIRKRMEKKKKHDKHVINAVYKGIRIILKAIGFIIFLGYVGIDTAGVGAVVSSLGVVIGLAVQGSLSNLAGGVVILIMRPFKLGDYIEAQGYSGTVEEIHVFYTYIATPDNKVVMIPNGTLANGNMVNYSKKELRRVDLVFSASYGSDVEKVKEIIKTIVESHQLVLKNPAPSIELSELAASSLDFSCKVWVKNADYWRVNFDLLKDVTKAFEENKIEVPFNQLDVHIVK